MHPLTPSPPHLDNRPLHTHAQDWIIDNQPLEEWSVHDVQEWLFSIGLSEQTPIFLKEQVNGQRLIQLELNDFEGLGLSEETIDKLRDAFKDLPIRRESVRPSVSRLDFSSVSDNDKRSSWIEGTVSRIDNVPLPNTNIAKSEVPVQPCPPCPLYPPSFRPDPIAFLSPPPPLVHDQSHHRPERPRGAVGLLRRAKLAPIRGL